MLFLEKLRAVTQDTSTVKGKIFDYFIQVLILLSLLAFTIETFPNNSKSTIKLLNTFEFLCVIIFSVEYLLRVFVSKKPLKYLIGVGIVSIPAGLVASALSKARKILSKESRNKNN